MGLKGKIFKFMSDTLKDGSYYKFVIHTGEIYLSLWLAKGIFLNYVGSIDIVGLSSATDYHRKGII